MKTPCDEAVIDSRLAAAPCAQDAGPWILAATILGSSMAFIDSTVVNVALPALQTSLGGTLTDIQWVVEAYGLLLGALILVGGSLGDRYGRRRMFLSGVTIFAFASVACGLAPNLPELILARAVQGLGAAFLVPGSLSIISASFGERERGSAIGTWSGSTAITAAIGPVLGGWLIDHASWRWAFFINVPIAAAVIVISLWRVPESKSFAPGKVDWRGALLTPISLGGLVYGFIEAPRLGWSHPYVLAALGIGCVSLAAFFITESRVEFPMAPWALFRSPDFSGANLLTIFLYAALGIFFFLFPLDLIQIQHYSPTATGAAMLPFILLMFLLSRWSGGLVARYAPRRPLMIGPVIASAGFLLCAVPSIGGYYWETFFPALLVLGFGLAVSVAPLTTVVMNSVDQNRTGTASGINNAVARVAGLLSIAVLGAVMTSAFGIRLERNLADLNVPTEAMRYLQTNEIRLGALTLPAGLDPPMAGAIGAAIDRAFVFGFRFVMMICAGLSLVSALVAWKMITARSSTVTTASARDSASG
jgi:EmrB/QacA subfamily drug resistance transporter